MQRGPFYLGFVLLLLICGSLVAWAYGESGVYCLGHGNHTDTGLSPSALLSCFNRTLKGFDISIENVAMNDAEAKAKFIVVQYMTPNLYSYGAYSFGVTVWYCRRHGYELTLFDPETLQSINTMNRLNNKVRDERWNKVLILRESISRILAHEQHNLNSYVIWMDSDLIVVDMNMKIEQFTQSFPYANFIMSKDFMEEHGAINSGFMIFKATEWSLQFLDMWWNISDKDKVSDQGAFSLLWAKLEHEKSYGIILEPDMLNSKFPVWYHFEEHHRVLHLAGVHDILRIHIFRTALENIDNSHSALNIDESGNSRIIYPHQLGLSRQQLEIILIDVRLNIVDNILLVGLDDNNPIYNSLEHINTIQEEIQVALQLGYAGRDIVHKQEANFQESVHSGKSTLSPSKITHDNSSFMEVSKASQIFLWLIASFKHNLKSKIKSHGTENFILMNLLQKNIEASFEFLEFLKMVPETIRIKMNSNNKHKDKLSYNAMYTDSLSGINSLLAHLNLIIQEFHDHAEQYQTSMIELIQYYYFKMHDYNACITTDDQEKVEFSNKAFAALIKIDQLREGNGNLSSLKVEMKEEASVAASRLGEYLCRSHVLDIRTRGHDTASIALELLRQVWSSRILPNHVKVMLYNAEAIVKNC